MVLQLGLGACHAPCDDVMSMGRSLAVVLTLPSTPRALAVHVQVCTIQGLGRGTRVRRFDAQTVGLARKPPLSGPC